jgi:hypothetical protein
MRAKRRAPKAPDEAAPWSGSGAIMKMADRAALRADGEVPPET